MVDPALASNTRSRTRQAILGAACTVLAHNHTATLPEIADAAGVSRTTLRRYFPDRDSLMNAAIQDSLDALERSVDEAAIEQGPPLEAMRRLVAAMVAVGDRLTFLFGDVRVLEGHETPEDLDSPADPVIDLIERGQAEGVFDPEVSPGWIQRALWGLVYTGCEDADQGRLPRHGVTNTVIRTFENGIRAR